MGVAEHGLQGASGSDQSNAKTSGPRRIRVRNNAIRSDTRIHAMVKNPASLESAKSPYSHLSKHFNGSRQVWSMLRIVLPVFQLPKPSILLLAVQHLG